MGIVKQSQENLEILLRFDKSDNTSQAQEMATNNADDHDPYYNTVEKKNGDKTEETGAKEKFSLRGNLPRFQFHDESELPPPPYHQDHQLDSSPFVL